MLSLKPLQALLLYLRSSPPQGKSPLGAAVSYLAMSYSIRSSHAGSLAKLKSVSVASIPLVHEKYHFYLESSSSLFHPQHQSPLVFKSPVEMLPTPEVGSPPSNMLSLLQISLSRDTTFNLHHQDESFPSFLDLLYSFPPLSSHKVRKKKKYVNHLEIVFISLHISIYSVTLFLPLDCKLF